MVWLIARAATDRVVMKVPGFAQLLQNAVALQLVSIDEDTHIHRVEVACSDHVSNSPLDSTLVARANTTQAGCHTIVAES